MVKKITLSGDNITIEDDVQTTPRELDELVKGDFSAHDTRHEEAGGDEVDPALHGSKHEDAGSDEIDITGLVGHQYGKNLLQNAAFIDTDGDDLPDFWSLEGTPTLVIAADTLFPARGGNQITITSTGAGFEGIEITPGASNPLLCLPSTTYTLSFDYKVTAGDELEVAIASFAGAVQKASTGGTLNSPDATRQSFSLTTSADSDNIRIVFTTANVGDIVFVSHPKVEQGSIATPYINETVINDLQVASDWRAVSDAWAFASASTITVPSGAADLYQVGDKIKITNPGIKYFYITSVADTVLTVTAGADFTVANSAITFPFHSHSENPLGFPAIFNWTPTLNGGGTILAGFTFAVFRISGKSLFFWFNATTFDTSGVAGQIFISLPLIGTPAYTKPIFIFDGAAVITSVATVDPTNTRIVVFKTAATGNWAPIEVGVQIQVEGNYTI